MNWSISSHKTFKQCPRRWYYKFKAADGRVKKVSERIEITRLSRLVTIDGWRGQIVDLVISEKVIRDIKQKKEVKAADLLHVARNIFDKQLEMATQQPPLNWGFVEIEYGKQFTGEQIDRAWSDIELALNNFCQNEILLSELYEAVLLLPQWTFQFRQGDINVKSIPDLVAFYKAGPPRIYDWKVNTFGTHVNEEQLITYAIALVRSKPQESFARFVSGISPCDIILKEVQLIANGKGLIREYDVDDRDVTKIEKLISNSALKIYGTDGFKKYDELLASDFETTDYPENCSNCSFKKFCKNVQP